MVDVTKLGFLFLCATTTSVVANANNVSSNAWKAGVERAKSFETTLKKNDWEVFSPKGDTGCIYDTEYFFYFREGHGENADKLVVEFEGGGACWDEASCNVPLFKLDVDPRKAISDSFYGFNVLVGIHDESPEKNNTFTGYNWLYVPYCTGDAHTGSKNDAVPGVNFNGFANAKSAVQWIQQRIPAPREIFITGSSAGCLGSAIWAPYIIEAYPRSITNHMGDSYIGIASERQMVLLIDSWDFVTAVNPTLRITKEELIAKGGRAAEYVFQVTASQFPNTVFSYFTSFADGVQSAWYVAGGGRIGIWTELMRAHLNQFRNTKNVAWYIGPGGKHSVIGFRDYWATGVTDEIDLPTWTDLIATNQIVGTRYQYIDCCPDDTHEEASPFNATDILIRESTKMLK